MTSDTDNLRRSKRNKYHLDLTALNLINPERRKQTTPLAVKEDRAEAAPSPGTSTEETALEYVKRSRRPTTKSASFVYADESEDEEEKMVSGMSGSFRCDKCPSRFESRPGLANHIRLHGRSDKRKFGCDHCDFSCGSAKAARNHHRIHSRPFKEDSEVPTNSDNRSDTSDSHTPPLLTPIRAVAVGGAGGENNPQPQQETPPPKLAAISPQAKHAERSGNRKRHRCQECPFATRNRRRFEGHLFMHQKSTGFQCFYCSLTTASSGFLKRHMIEIHKKTDFSWPPKWVHAETVKKEKENEGFVDRRGKRGLLLLREAKKEGDSLLCPVEGCPHRCYTRSQMVLHKIRVHLKKLNRPLHRCCSCGLKLRTPGALRVHRLVRHPRRKMAVKAKRTLFKEVRPSSHIMKVMQEMRKTAIVIGGENKSDPSTPLAPSPVDNQSPEMENVSSSLLGVELPECLNGLNFGVAELAAELAKSHENEFKCEECPFSTSARAKLERHMVKHQIKSDIRCPLCTFSCRGDDLIKQHIRLHLAIIHKKKKDAEKLVGDLTQIVSTPTEAMTTPKANGEIGEKKKEQKPTLKRKKHSNVFINKEGIRMRRCLECPYVTKHACDLASHYNMHVSEPQRYKCTQCTYSTKRAVSLKVHFQCHKEHNEEQNAIKFLNLKANGFQIGKRTGKGKNRIYTCRSCPFVSKSLVLLHQHNRRHINVKGAAYKCSKCPFYSIYCEIVEDHILIHPEMDVQTERLVPLTRGKRHLDENSGKTTPLSRPKRTPKSSAAPSPAPPVLVKEEPMDWKAMESESSKDTCISDLKSEASFSLDKPLSIVVQDFIRPEPALMKILRREKNAEEVGKCPDCPYQESDELMMRLHRECHQGSPRLQRCDLCSYSCMAPEALHRHISLHVPALSPNSEAQQRKKHTQRRRAAGIEVIPHGVPHYSCNKCTFKCLTKDGYQEHMMFHAQELQRRLMTTIKRANTAQKQREEEEQKQKGRRNPKKSDKFHACPHCSFRCETFAAFVRHTEMHEKKQEHKCDICSYSAHTFSITLFHMMNHHSDHTLSTLSKSAVLAPKAISMKVDRSEEKIREMADNVYQCNRCPDFICYELLQLRRHFETKHFDSKDDKEAVESLAMGMLPRNSVITTA